MFDFPFCPKCGTEVLQGDVFCPACGEKQGPKVVEVPYRERSQPERRVIYRQSSKQQFNTGICLFLCCCFSPIVGLVYYILTDH